MCSRTGVRIFFTLSLSTNYSFRIVADSNSCPLARSHRLRRKALYLRVRLLENQQCSHLKSPSAFKYDLCSLLKQVTSLIAPPALDRRRHHHAIRRCRQVAIVLVAKLSLNPFSIQFDYWSSSGRGNGAFSEVAGPLHRKAQDKWDR